MIAALLLTAAVQGGNANAALVDASQPASTQFRVDELRPFPVIVGDAARPTPLRTLAHPSELRDPFVDRPVEALTAKVTAQRVDELRDPFLGRSSELREQPWRPSSSELRDPFSR